MTYNRNYLKYMLIIKQILVEIMGYPYRILLGRIQATAQDLETWIRHCLGTHLFLVERRNLDDTTKRFTLHFKQQIRLNPAEPIEIHWGGIEIIE